MKRGARKGRRGGEERNMEVQVRLAPRMDEMGEEVKRSQWGRTVDICPRGAAALKGVASQRVYQCRHTDTRAQTQR